jgi:hypothetical protein
MYRFLDLKNGILRWVGHVACMEKKRHPCTVLREERKVK